MSNKRRATAFERGRAFWLLIPESQRTAVRVQQDLRSEGIVVSKATVSRWAIEWRAGAGEQFDSLILGAASFAQGTPDLSDVPDWAKAALPKRVWLVAKGTGLDRVENAATVLASAVAAAAPQYVKALLEGDDQPLRTATGAVVAAASIMERIVHARAMAVVAHRACSEADKLEAKARSESEGACQDR